MTENLLTLMVDTIQCERDRQTDGQREGQTHTGRPQIPRRGLRNSVLDRSRRLPLNLHPWSLRIINRRW